MNQVNYANILRHAADSLQGEGRHNQASILSDAAQAFEEIQKEIRDLRIRNGNFEVIEKAFFQIVAPDGFMQVGIYETCPVCNKEGKHADGCELAAALGGEQA